MEDILLLQFLKKKGIITADDMHEFHELTQYGVNDQMYEKVYLNNEQTKIADSYNKSHEPISYSSSRLTEEHLTEHQAKDMVSEMYHIDSNRKYIGEKFDIYKAKEICERYRSMIPKEANYIDVYLAINSQYHNYICLFKQWFDASEIDCKIVQSAIHYWFNDDDWAYKDKVQKLFK